MSSHRAQVSGQCTHCHAITNRDPNTMTVYRRPDGTAVAQGVCPDCAAPNTWPASALLVYELTKHARVRILYPPAELVERADQEHAAAPFTPVDVVEFVVNLESVRTLEDLTRETQT